MEWQMLQQLGNASKKLPTVAARFERKLAVRRVSFLSTLIPSMAINPLSFTAKAEFGLKTI